MKFTSYLLRGVLLLASCGWLSVPSRAEWARTPLQLSLWHPVQLFEEDVDVIGLRLGGYGVNTTVTGLDIQLASRTLVKQTGLQIGLFNAVEGDMNGFQFGVANLVGNYHTGWQGGFFNKISGELSGLQTGPMNMALGLMTGVQIGVINYAKDATGLQIGVFNSAQLMYGVQIGLINIIADKDNLPILPFFNAAF